MELARLMEDWWEASGRVPWQVIAHRGGLEPAKVAGFHTGKQDNPTIKTLERIARGFDVSLAEFLAGPPKKDAPAADAGRAASPRLHSVAPLVAPEGPAQAVNTGGADEEAHTDTETALDRRPVGPAALQAALDRLEAAVAALNAVTARAALADARREAATARARRAARRQRARKHR